MRKLGGPRSRNSAKPFRLPIFVDAEKSKPHPDIFEAALEELGNVTPDRAIVVGDTPYAAEAAAKTKLRTIGLMCGGWNERDLRQAGWARAIAGALLSLCARKFFGGSRLKRAAWLVCAAFAHRVRMIWIQWQSYSGVDRLTDDRPERSSVGWVKRSDTHPSFSPIRGLRSVQLLVGDLCETLNLY